MEKRIKSIMAAVFGIDSADVSDDASPDTIESWDSLRHMKLVLALEEDFGIQFHDDQIPELLNFKLIKFSVSECVKTKV